MIGLNISLRKPRTGDFITIEGDKAKCEIIAGVGITVSNTREKPIYLKWRI